MKNCPKCGAELADDVRYCTSCGAPQVVEEVKEAAEEVAEEVKETAEEVKAESDAKKADFEARAKEAAGKVEDAAAKVGAAAKEGWDKLNDKYGDKAKEAGEKAKEGFEKVMDTADTTAEFDPADIEATKVLSLFAYLGILFIIPLVAAKDSKYARFHTNQGIVLFIFAIVLGILSTMKWVGWIFSICEILVTVFAILGIINAVSGKAKELPLIGKFRILK